FVAAFNSTATRNTPVRYTAPAREGPWTRDGPVYSCRPGSIQALSADAGVGDRTVAVGDSSVFTVGDPVFVQDNLMATPAVNKPDNWEANSVAALPDGGHVTLLNPLLNAYLTSRAAEIVVVDQLKVMAR